MVLTAVDYGLAHYISTGRRFRLPLLILGLIINLSVWFHFKYSLGILSFLSPNIGFPLGISFYLLRKLSYLIDIYRRQIPAAHKFIDYVLYVSYFPQVFSGPIEKAREFMPQISANRQFDWQLLQNALPLFILGLMKKIVIADNLRIIVERIFNLESPSRFLLAIGSLGFTFEIFADFSAYTDISRGISYLLGFNSSKNFNSPYLALTPQDFWNRWHISFSTWLRDYIFFPLRRLTLKLFGRSSIFPEVIPLIFTMLISGIWHGNGWNFILWGLFHGILLAVYRHLGLNEARNRGFLLIFINWLVMFGLIVLSWMIFRAPSIEWIRSVIIDGAWGFTGRFLTAGLSVLSMVLAYSIPLVLFELLKTTGKYERVLQLMYYAAAVVVMLVFIGSGTQDFVYFEF